MKNGPKDRCFSGVEAQAAIVPNSFGGPKGRRRGRGVKSGATRWSGGEEHERKR